MKELFYYSIFAVVLYFILTRIFENFYLEQENFDPSLVPVSSIVTLAKVAQKLVNGNGTLTNPGNLTLTGGFRVNGKLSTDGNLNQRVLSAQIDNIRLGGNVISNNDTASNLLIGSANSKVQIWTSDLEVDKDLKVGKNLNVTGNVTSATLSTGVGGMGSTGQIISNLGYTGYNPAGWQEAAKFPFGIVAGTDTNAQTIKSFGPVISNSLTVGPGSIQFNGPVTAGATLSAGTTTLSSATINGMLNAPGNIEIANTNPYITFAKSNQEHRPQLYSDGGTIHVHGGHLKVDNNFTVDNTTTLNNGLTVTGNVTATGNIKGGQLCIGSTCINETQLKILTGQTFVNVRNEKGANLSNYRYTTGGGRAAVVINNLTSHSDIGSDYNSNKYTFVPV